MMMMELKQVLKNGGLFDSVKKLGAGSVKYLSEFLNFNLGPNMWYNFGGGR